MRTVRSTCLSQCRITKEIRTVNRPTPNNFSPAAYATCFAGAIQAISKDHGVDDLGDFKVTAVVSFNKDDDGFFIASTLDCLLPTVDTEKGEELVNAAHEICPYSKATRDNITVKLNLLVEN